MAGETGSIPDQYLDFLLLKEVYHCTPAEMDEQDDATVRMHIEFLRIQAEQSKLNQHREKQRNKK